MADLIEAIGIALESLASSDTASPAVPVEERPIGPGVRDAVLCRLDFDETTPDVKVLAITSVLGAIDVMGGWSPMRRPRNKLRPSTLAPVVGFQICRPRMLGPFRLYF